MSALIKYAAPGVVIALLGVVLWWSVGQIKMLATKLELTESALKLERANAAGLKRQYANIQERLDDVAKQKRASEREMERVRVELDEAQRAIPCAFHHVPDTVTLRLRERVAAVNAAADAE